jgi:hypothetical protein
MSSSAYPIIESRLTAPRMGPYLAECSGDVDKTLALYSWNMKISAAFFADLGTAEVALRNAIDAKMRDRFQNASQPSPWYDQIRLSTEGRDQLTQAKNRAQTGRIRNRVTDPPTQDDIVASLTFGFWRSLLTTQYQTIVWPTVRSAFGDDPTRQAPARLDIYEMVDQMGFLRNRIAHHEPIFTRNLARQHQLLLRLTGSICQVTSQWLSVQSEAPTVLAARP